MTFAFYSLLQSSMLDKPKILHRNAFLAPPLAIKRGLLVSADGGQRHGLWVSLRQGLSKLVAAYPQL